MHCDKIATSRPGIAKRIVNRNPGAHKWTHFLRRQIAWNRGHCFRTYNDVLRVTAVEVDPGNLALHAHREVAPAAGITNKTMSAVPANANSLASAPLGHVSA